MTMIEMTMAASIVSSMGKNTVYVHSIYIDEPIVVMSVAGYFGTAYGQHVYAQGVMAKNVRDAQGELRWESIRNLLAECVNVLDVVTTYYDDDVHTWPYISLCTICIAIDAVQTTFNAGEMFISHNLFAKMFTVFTYVVKHNNNCDVLTNVLNFSSCSHSLPAIPTAAQSPRPWYDASDRTVASRKHFRTPFQGT